MIACIVITHHQDVCAMLKATEQWAPYRVLVVDRSPETNIEGWENVVRITDGDGFQAGRVRNTGIKYAVDTFNPDGIVCFDGDRIPSGEFKPIQGFDCVLWSAAEDSRLELAGDVTANCGSIESPFYSAGFYLSRKAIDELDGVVFDSDFDGLWGWEDTNLGDRLVAKGFRIWLSKELKVSGKFIEPDFVRSSPADDPRLRNWWKRLEKRRRTMSDKQQTQKSYQELAQIYSQGAALISNSIPVSIRAMSDAVQGMVNLIEAQAAEIQRLASELEKARPKGGKNGRK